MKPSLFFIVGILALKSVFGVADETKSTLDESRSTSELLPSRTSNIVRNFQKKYACGPLSSHTDSRAEELILEFERPRDDEGVKFQASCWSPAESTIRDLQSDNPALANVLKNKLTENRNIIEVQAAVGACTTSKSNFGKQLKKILEYEIPFENTFRTIPIEIPPKVSKKDSLRQFRQALYSESLTESVERGVLLARTHGLKFSDIVDKVCPSESPCSKSTRPRDLRAYLQTRYEALSRADVPRRSDSDVYHSLQNALIRLNQQAKSFNSQITCHNYGTVLTGSNEICNSKSTDEATGRFNSRYYDFVDDVLGSDIGSLLGHEPYKQDLKSMYGGYPLPIKINNETTYALFKKHNEPPGWDMINNKTAWHKLPADLSIAGGPESVARAAQNAFNNTMKYAQELNHIEEAVSRGRDPDYGIFSLGDPEMQGLSLMARLNPRATARVLLNNPDLARTSVLCQMMEAGAKFEREKEIEGKIQTWLGNGTLVVGLGMALVPTGVTQVAGPSVAGLGTALIVGGSAISAKGLSDNYGWSSRAGAAYSATENVGLKYEREKAGSEAVNAVPQIIGDALILKAVSKEARALRAAGEQSKTTNPLTRVKVSDRLYPEEREREVRRPVKGNITPPSLTTAPPSWQEKYPRVSQTVDAMKETVAPRMKQGQITSLGESPVFSDVKIPRDPETQEMIRKAYNRLHNPDEVTQYVEKLMNDAAEDTAKRNIPSEVQALKNGEVTRRSVLRVLVKRAQARGEVVSTQVDSREDTLAKNMSQGPFFDKAFKLHGAKMKGDGREIRKVRDMANLHGVDNHLLQHDMVSDLVNPKFYDYLANDINGNKVWNALFDAPPDRLFDLSSPAGVTNLLRPYLHTE